MSASIIGSSVVIDVQLKNFTSLMNCFEIQTKAKYLFVLYKWKSEICFSFNNFCNNVIFRHRKL